MLTVHMYTDQSYKSLFLDIQSSSILDIHTFDNEECYSSPLSVELLSYSHGLFGIDPQFT